MTYKYESETQADRDYWDAFHRRQAAQLDFWFDADVAEWDEATK